MAGQSKVEDTFVARVVGAAIQGAAGALVAACLSAVTEPVVNRVLVNRMSLSEAIAQVDFESVAKFFNTTVTTNFIKFPFFEVVNMMLSNVALTGSAKGALLGAVFTTVTLPITNYRYCKSVGVPVEIGALYKAFLPTVLRDIVYGICRNNVSSALMAKYPTLNQSNAGKFVLMFITVLAACVISAPGNEVRGYYLQPNNRRLPVKEFFKPDRFIRSTTIGGLIMATALGCGSVITGPATEQFNSIKSFLDANPVAKTMVFIWAVQHIVTSKRHSEFLEKQDEIMEKMKKQE